MVISLLAAQPSHYEAHCYAYNPKPAHYVLQQIYMHKYYIIKNIRHTSIIYDYTLHV